MNLGERIKSARQAAGLSLRELAERVGVSHNAISKYERGMDVPGSTVLLRLAEELNVKIDYFFRDTKVELSTPAFRKKMSMSKKKEDAILAQISDWLERYLEVENLFFAKHPRFLIPEEMDREIRSVEEAERVAEQLRILWQIGTDPINNLTELLEEKGIKVGIVDAYPEFDACTLEEKNLGTLIAINRNMSADRQRFNLAHELAHIIIQVADGIDEEKAAHRFAGAFLVPAEAARRELGEKRFTINPVELHLLKHKYGMSMQGWIYRVKDLQIISELQAANMFKTFRMKKWHVQEPGDPLPAEIPQRMDRLIIRALAEGMISEPRAAEFLGKPLMQFWREVAEEHKWGLEQF